MHFLRIYVCPTLCIQEVISQHLYGISTKFFQYSKDYDLLSDHHLCQVAPKSQSRSHFELDGPKLTYSYICSLAVVKFTDCTTQSKIPRESTKKQISHQIIISGMIWEFLMPIFHCNANPFVLGSCVGLDTQREHFKFGIRTCWYLKAFADPTQTHGNPKQPPSDPTQASANIVQIRVGHFWLGSHLACRFHVVCAPFSTLGKRTRFLVEYRL